MKRKLQIMVLMLLGIVLSINQVWGAEPVSLAKWTISTKPTSGSPIAMSSGTATGSTCTLTGTIGGIKTKDNYSVVYFSAISNVKFSLKVPQAIPAGTELSFKFDASYNKASNAPWKGVSIKVKEGSSTEGTNGLSFTSLSFTTSVSNYSFTYTTQTNVAKDAIILVTLTQTGKAGSGEGYFNNAEITTQSGSPKTSV